MSTIRFAFSSLRGGRQGGASSSSREDRNNGRGGSEENVTNARDDGVSSFGSGYDSPVYNGNVSNNESNYTNDNNNFHRMNREPPPPDEFLPPPSTTLPPSSYDQSSFTGEEAEGAFPSFPLPITALYALRSEQDDEEEEEDERYNNSNNTRRTEEQARTQFPERAIHRLDTIRLHITPLASILASSIPRSAIATATTSAGLNSEEAEDFAVAGEQDAIVNSEAEEVVPVRNVVAESAVQGRSAIEEIMVVENVGQPPVEEVVAEERGPYTPTMEGAGDPPKSEPFYYQYAVLLLPAAALMILLLKPSILSHGISAICKKIF